VAGTLNIPCIGTVGLLLLAKQQGMLDSMTLAIQSLKAYGLWLSDDQREIFDRRSWIIRG
jgi:predicted nucleic acid-binding protein